MPPKVNHAAALALPVRERQGYALEWSCVAAYCVESKECRCCATSYTGGPDRIARHILGLGGGIGACSLKNGNPVVQAEFEEIKLVLAERKARADEVSKQRGQAASDECDATVAASSAASARNTIDLTQRSLPGVFAGQTNATPTPISVNLSLSKAFIGCGVPLHIVENPQFREALTQVALSGQRFLKVNQTTKQLESQLATRQAFSGTLLEQTDASVMERVLALKVPMTVDTGLSVMSDGMESITHRPLLNVLCSNPAGQFFVKVIDASGMDKTKEYIAEQAILMIEAEGAENVVTLIMDGACRSSFPLVNHKYPHVICMVCAAHSLDLLLEDFAKVDKQGPVVAGDERFAFDTSFSRETLQANREIVRFITNHQKSLATYRACVAALPSGQKPTGGAELLKPAATRFATEYIASERAYNCRVPLEQTVVASDFNTWLANQKDSVKAAGANVKRLVLDVTHWDSTKAIVEVSRPIYILLRLCDGACATMYQYSYHYL